ncbi:MAG: META domain-containing protein [Nitriliruptorales bacterium]|nr:META domain-containing protein [Nitriliruptorales bacterium]
MKFTQTVPLAVLLVAALLAAGCGELFGAVSGPAGYLGQWVLVDSSVDGAPIDVPDDRRITLTIEEEQLGGTAACNSYGGGHAITGNSFQTEGFMMTEMACEPQGAMEAESRYMAALSAVDTIRREGDQLVLTGPGIELTFDPVAPVEDEAVVGTRWVLDTLIDGEVASSVQGDGFLLLREDGSLDGSTGCRDLHGRWELNGDQLVLPQFGADGDCEAALRDQDSHVIGVLEGGRLEVDGKRLTVTADGGQGLGYRAEN